MTYPVASWWRYDYNWILTLRVFRPGLLSNVRSLGQIGQCMAELKQLPFPLRNIKLCQAAPDMPFNENSRSSQFNIAKAFRIDWPNIMLMPLNLWEEFISTYDYMTIIRIWAWKCVQVRSLIKHVKFEADWTLYAWIITTSYFMAKHRSLSGCHGHDLQRKLKIFAI